MKKPKVKRTFAGAQERVDKIQPKIAHYLVPQPRKVKQKHGKKQKPREGSW